MFGFKKNHPSNEKSKEIEVILEPVLDVETELEEVAESKNEGAQSTDEEVSITQLLGVSEQRLKSEFYQFQLKKLLTKIGSLSKEEVDTPNQVENFLLSSVKNGVTDFIVSPLEFSVYKGVAKRLKLNGLTFKVTSDGLNGEGSFKGRHYAVKSLCKSGADGVIYPFPKRAYALSLLGESKRRAYKTIKASKKPIVLEIEYSENPAFMKTVKALGAIKADAFMLSTAGAPTQKVIEQIESVSSQINGKKLFLKVPDCNEKDFCHFTRLGVAKVYTFNAQNLVQTLSKRFSLNSDN
ncbi:MAG: hypothetical protein IKZ38_02145 [Clostridia bacterium]|nr:hypothetical protein [Clostridia bacterium]